MTRSEIFRSKMKLEAEKRKKQDSQQSLFAKVNDNTDVGIDKEKGIGKEPGE